MKSKTSSIVIFLVVMAVLVVAVTLIVSSGDQKNIVPTSKQDGNIISSSTPKIDTKNPIDSTTTKTYTLTDIARHASAKDCWTTVNGGVYDLTSFIPNHPGGNLILKICGIDGTSVFTGQHGGQKQPENELAKLKIGTLAK